MKALPHKHDRKRSDNKNHLKDLKALFRVTVVNRTPPHPIFKRNIRRKPCIINYQPQTFLGRKLEHPHVLTWVFPCVFLGGLKTGPNF